MNGSLAKWTWQLVFGVLAGACLAAPVQATTVEYIHTDALGSPVAVTNAAGVVIERTEYEPYGKVQNAPPADGPGYTGHVLDAATGLNYMQQRYYDPGIGRFLSVDPVTANGNTGSNFNRYWYANNNPYKFTDPDGRWPNGLGGPCDLRPCTGGLPGIRSIGPLNCPDCSYPSKSKKYKTKSGVRMSASVEEKVGRIADKYNDETGKTITVTDGDRTASEQAGEMYNKIIRGAGLGLYSNRIAAAQIQASYNQAAANGGTPEEIVSAITRTINDQIANGVFISKHLTGGGVDVRSRDMNTVEKVIFRQSTSGIASSIILEGGRNEPHFHLQFSGDQ